MDNLGSLDGLSPHVRLRVSKKGCIHYTERPTVLVDTGIYAVARHPQFLGGVLISLALILIAQHWLIAMIGVAAMVLSYVIALKEDQWLVEKFGDDYKRYMQSVPRMNLLVGAIQLLRRRKRD